jgi:hypothetical protein
LESFLRLFRVALQHLSNETRRACGLVDPPSGKALCRARAPLPACVARLLWDIDPAAVDLERDATLILGGSNVIRPPSSSAVVDDTGD